MTAQDVDARLMRLNEGVECALRRAKVWSKYAKDVMSYVEKRAQLGKFESNVPPQYQLFVFVIPS